METKHTKGEWFIQGKNLIKCGNEQIGSVNSMLDEYEANAKLIAAAPELLEALNPFAELFKQFDGTIGNRPSEGIIYAWHHNKHGEHVLTVEMLKNALNAIKKATE